MKKLLPILPYLIAAAALGALLYAVWQKKKEAAPVNIADGLVTPPEPKPPVDHMETEPITL